MGLATLRHVGSSQTRARTRVPCIGRQTLNHCATREAQVAPFKGGRLRAQTLEPDLGWSLNLSVLSFLICNIEIIVVLTSQDCCEVKWANSHKVLRNVPYTEKVLEKF